MCFRTIDRELYTHTWFVKRQEISIMLFCCCVVSFCHFFFLVEKVNKNGQILHIVLKYDIVMPNKFGVLV